MALILHARKTNKNTYKILTAAEYSGVEVKLAPNFEMGVSNKTLEYLRMNPIGKVPVLETPDGPIFESNAIARYVARLKTNNALYASSLIDYAQIEQWIDFSTLEIDANINAWYRPRMGQAPYHPSIVKVVSPLIKLLRIVDSDEKPSMPYVYEGMKRAKNGIKEIFQGDKNLYEPYTNIIQARWDKHLKTDLHATAYLLNHAFFYSDEFVKKNRLMESVTEVFETNSPDDIEHYIKLMQHIGVYRQRQQCFSKVACQKAAQRLVPHDWWLYCGGLIPELQQLAIRILSQTSTPSGCERNWSLFEQIHTKRRNRLEHQSIDDLVFINYNLKLKYRRTLKKKNENYDPIDYESIDKLDFFVGEENPTPDFDDVDVATLDNELQQITQDYGGDGDAHVTQSLNDDVAPSTFGFPRASPPPDISLPIDLNDVNSNFGVDDYQFSDPSVVCG